MKKDKRKQALLKLAKETPAVRKQRVSSGVKLRAAVFASKKKQPRKMVEDE